MTKKLLQLYGLKWNPFTADVPTEALHVPARLDSFGWRVEQLVREGGFAVILGDPGTGKSVALRLLAARLATLRDVVVGVLTRPHAGVADGYRELGHLFGVSLSPHNRWAGAKALRDTWRAHIEAARFRPVLLVDEAQDVRTEVLNELRLLASADLDARVILTVVLAGDRRLQARLREVELLPLESRLRVKLLLDTAPRDDLAQCLRHALEQAGNPRLLTPGLLDTLVDHAGGNHRTLMAHAHELLLSIEHRAAPSTSGLSLALRDTEGAVALQLVDTTVTPRDAPPSPIARVEDVLLHSDRPVSLTELRQACRMRTASLCQALATLTAQGRLHKSAAGYQLTALSRATFPATALQPAGNGNG